MHIIFYSLKLKARFYFLLENMLLILKMKNEKFLQLFIFNC